jgi:hypothetical protein
MKLPQKFLSFAQDELERVRQNLIFRHGNTIYLFGRYRISHHDGIFRVECNTQDSREFASVRSAMSYCVFSNRHMIQQAERLHQLDERSRVLEQSISTRQRLLTDSRSSADRAVIQSKMDHRRQEKYTVDQQLEKCLLQAKYIQLRGFYHDTK